MPYAPCPFSQPLQLHGRRHDLAAARRPSHSPPPRPRPPPIHGGPSHLLLRRTTTTADAHPPLLPLVVQVINSYRYRSQHQYHIHGGKMQPTYLACLKSLQLKTYDNTPLKKGMLASYMCCIMRPCAGIRPPAYPAPTCYLTSPHCPCHSDRYDTWTQAKGPASGGTCASDDMWCLYSHTLDNVNTHIRESYAKATWANKLTETAAVVTGNPVTSKGQVICVLNAGRSGPGDHNFLIQ